MESCILLLKPEGSEKYFEAKCGNFDLVIVQMASGAPITICNQIENFSLWHCWLGDRKGIRPVKSWGCWFVGGDDLTGAQACTTCPRGEERGRGIPWRLPTYIQLILCLLFLVDLVRLSIPVQVTDRKDWSPKWPIMCWWGCWTLSIQSLIYN